MSPVDVATTHVGAAEPTIRQQFKSLATAIFLIFLVGIALSLSVALLAIEMERMRVDSFTAGLNTAMLGLGKIAIVFFIPRLAKAFGVRPILLIATTGLARQQCGGREANAGGRTHHQHAPSRETQIHLTHPRLSKRRLDRTAFAGKPARRTMPACRGRPSCGSCPPPPARFSNCEIVFPASF